MKDGIRSSGVFLYRPPDADCPWLVVTFNNSQVRQALPFALEDEARKALIEQTTLFVQSHTKDDLD